MGESLKKGLKAILGLGLIAGIAIGALFFAEKAQLDPDVIFAKKLIGKWFNIPKSNGTWIDFKDEGICEYYTEGKSQKCVYQVRHGVVYIGLSVGKEVLKSISNSDKGSYDLREDIEIGWSLSGVTVRSGILSGKRRIIAGGRETVATTIKLAKDNILKKSKKRRKRSRRKRKK